jgi:hypothetical protein
MERGEVERNDELPVDLLEEWQMECGEGKTMNCLAIVRLLMGACKKGLELILQSSYNLSVKSKSSSWNEKLLTTQLFGNCRLFDRQ